ncbi:MAG: hypothetical protein Q8R95_14905, partial [Azonexus sp.]|nr:hypothetical protein [Azonexus sp.]
MALSLTPIFLFIVGFDLWVLNSRPELLSDGSALTDSSPVLAPGTLSVLVIGAIFALFALFSARWVWRVQRQTATQL